MLLSPRAAGAIEICLDAIYPIPIEPFNMAVHVHIQENKLGMPSLHSCLVSQNSIHMDDSIDGIYLE